ncbi:MAG: ribonuclease III [Phycisphaerales bacterium]
MIDPALRRTAEELLGYTFESPHYLEEAVTHASVADSRLESNERLEFLGDAILGMVVCDYLFRHYPDLLEGDLTKIKSAAVSRRACAKVARRLGLEELLRLGKGMSNRDDLPSSLAAAAFESIIAAIYLDGGFEPARDFILTHMEGVIERAADSGHQQNFKSILQQYAQREIGSPAAYLLLDENGPDHAKCFEVCVEIGDRRFESSWAGSKKQAEQKAALNALLELGVVECDDEDEIRLVEASAGYGNGLSEK